MILIADSGSTKTDWRLIENETSILSFSTQGINPYFQSADEILNILKAELEVQIKIELTDLKIYYYGAGCSSEEKINILKKALLSVFPAVKIEVTEDLLAAARSVCGNKAGIAAILGTGSNTCYYDGKSIIKNIDSTGFILGDEGSGAYIGKKFIQNLLHFKVPENLAKKFKKEYNLDRSKILDAVYTKALPSRFLASISKFIGENIQEKYCTDLITNCFIDLFDNYICNYDQHKTVDLNCVGSIAFYYQDILKKVAENKNVKLGTVIKSPIDGLVKFHLGN